MICFYCGRAWFLVFKSRSATNTLTKLITAVGLNSELLEEFKGQRAWVLEKCLAAGTRQIRIQHVKDTTVTVTDRNLTSVEGADFHIELDWYKNHYEWRGMGPGLGDPRTNGLGHAVATVDGVLGVVVKGPPIKNLKTAKQNIVDIVRVEDDGMVQTGPDHFRQVRDNIAAGFGIINSPAASSDAPVAPIATARKAPQPRPPPGSGPAPGAYPSQGLWSVYGSQLYRILVGGFPKGSPGNRECPKRPSFYEHGP